jgi:uncharacterized protein involved in exopolysaccharide biosynthesis
MSILQFWRIIWARRWFVLGATVACVAGAYILTLLLPPRWEADARVMLNLLKADSVTGQVIMGAGTRTYVNSQAELITDYGVASRVVESLGWVTDPNLIAAYDKRSAADTRDFRHWLAQMIIDRTKVDLVDGSNILEISYTGPSADNSRTVAEAIRSAYLTTSLSLRRDDANRAADWFDGQALKAKSDLDTAEAAEASYEHDNNVFMVNDTTDLDSARFASLAGANGGGAAAAGGDGGVALAEVDAEIAQLSQTLGPNHPQLIALRAKRAALASAAARANAAIGAAASTHDHKSALDAEAAALIAKSPKLGRLRQLHAEVAVRRDLYNKTVARAADLRQQAAAADTGLSPMGAATVPAAPSFPNVSLIMFGSLGLGLALGLMVAILLELLHRRVRGPEDLQSGLDIPLLAVVSA